MRLQGWESRLAQIIAEAQSRPYQLGVHDCFRVACQVVHALTGVDRWTEFSGYTTEREALHRLAGYGSSFLAAGDRFFACAHERRAVLARRGDVVAYQDAIGKWHLGVCDGGRFCALGTDGLVWHPLRSAAACWRVG